MSTTNSEPALTADEAALTQYLDGHLNPVAAADLEAAKPEATVLRGFLSALRPHLVAIQPALKNADFLESEILRRITPEAQSAKTEQSRSPFRLWRLAFAAAVCFAAAFVVFKLFVPTEPPPPPYLAQVLKLEPGAPQFDVIQIEMDGVTILWTDGMEDLPKGYTF